MVPAGGLLRDQMYLIWNKHNYLSKSGWGPYPFARRFPTKEAAVEFIRQCEGALDECVVVEHPRSSMTAIDRISSHPRVQSVSDEGEDGIWVYLKPGFIWRHGDVHSLHERDTALLLRMLDTEIEPCTCGECTRP
jgi:hypothetical protein